jgi:hypothetical protein
MKFIKRIHFLLYITVLFHLNYAISQNCKFVNKHEYQNNLEVEKAPVNLDNLSKKAYKDSAKIVFYWISGSTDWLRIPFGDSICKLISKSDPIQIHSFEYTQFGNSGKGSMQQLKVICDSALTVHFNVNFRENIVLVNAFDKDYLNYIIQKYNLQIYKSCIRCNSCNNYYNLMGNNENSAFPEIIDKINLIIQNYGNDNYISKLNRKMLEIQKNIDSIKLNSNKISKSQDYLSLDFYLSIRSLPVIQKFYLLNCSNNISFRISHNHYGNRNKKLRIGTDMGLAIAKTGFVIEPANRSVLRENVGLFTQQVADETLQYQRMAYMAGLKEKVSLTNGIMRLGVAAKLSSNENKDSKLQLLLTSGFILNYNISSHYSATAGVASWGGIFSQYGTDTMFSGTGDFYTGVVVNSQKQNLKMQSTNFGLYGGISALIFCNKSKSCAIRAGYRAEATKFYLTPNDNDKILHFNNESYNSLLYRNSNLRLLQHLVELGLTIRI